MLSARSLMLHALRVGLASAILAGTAARGAAQTTSQIPLQFDFLTPGARSMATGGAFIGAADDATAAFTNPAGLARLTRREFSAEARFRRFETPYLSGGRISGSITGQGLDVIPGSVYSNDVDTSVSPSFFSMLLPFSAGTLTVYFHQMADIENSFLSNGVFERFTFGGITDDNGREIPIGGTRNIGIMTGGATFGHALTDRIAIGGGITLAHLSLDSSFARLGIESLFGPVLPNVKSATAVQSAHDTAVSANAGALFQLTGNVKVGATYRSGPRFSFTQEDRVFDAGTDLTRRGDFKVPDIAGAGFEWRLTDNLRALGDYDFVRYSQIKRDFIDFQAISSNRADQIVVDDAHELHGGVEYLLLRWANLPLAFRGGLWRDPSHAPRYVPTPQHDELDVLLSATLPGTTDLVHYTFGAGVVVGGRVELNGAADLSSRTRYVTTSAVVRF
jgi:long-subunit fatty acid transport protein